MIVPCVVLLGESDMFRGMIPVIVMVGGWVLLAIVMVGTVREVGKTLTVEAHALELMVEVEVLFGQSMQLVAPATLN